MRWHILQHVPFEGPGYIATALQQQGHVCTYTRWYRGESVPDVSMVDGLVVMGGPMGVYDEATYPWLVEEKRFLSTMLDAGKPILGICLGAQLLAHVLGARVHTGACREIGWFPVYRSTASCAQSMVSVFPETFMAFHWHGDVFELPQGACPLAFSEACSQQGFWIGEHVVGLQFHLEVTPEIVHALVEQGANELRQSEPYVQSPDRILTPSEETYTAMHRILDNVLNRLIARIP